ncbi:MCE family protein [Actinoplanes sp. NPDC048791]|uniref:MCE family protein n=1 Tax=Actinoplanes sp. NPDC048791 TaxID=3154623 RepID=UPI0033C33D7D
MNRRPRLLVLPAVVMLLFGCGPGAFSGASDLPLPGGADLGPHPYRVVADFADVLDLVPHAAVRVNNVPVGRVAKVELPDGSWTARVTMLVNGSVRLPANAVARLHQSSLLGEKYVQLAAPADGSGAGTLSDGAEIPLARTNRNPEVEEVLGALSMLLNGGGIAQLRTITVELNNALDGNEPEIKALLKNIDTLMSSLDDNRADITAAIDALNRFSGALAQRDQQIGAILDDLAPGLRVLEQQRGELVTMLQSLDSLSHTAVDTIERSQADLVADLKLLDPVLRQLSNAGQALPQALQILLTYPFTDATLDTIKGDYLNVYLSLVAAPGTTVIPPLTPGDAIAAAARKVQGRHPPASTTPSTPGASAPPLPLPIVSSTPPWGTTPSTATSPSQIGPPSQAVPPSASAPESPPASSSPPSASTPEPSTPGPSTPSASSEPSAGGAG